jgi:hypothetical protein
MHRELITVFVGLLPFVLRAFYTAAYKFKSQLGRPSGYEIMLGRLGVLTVVFLLVAFAILLIHGDWKLVFFIAATCACSQWIINVFTYRRAVDEVVNHLSTVPIERRVEMAMKIVIWMSKAVSAVSVFSRRLFSDEDCTDADETSRDLSQPRRG